MQGCLRAEIAAGPKAKLLAKTLAEHLADYIYSLRVSVGDCWADMTNRRIGRVLAQGNITKLSQLTVATVETAICELRCTPRKPRRPATDYALLSENSRNHHRQVVKSWAKWLWEDGRLPDHPLRKLKKRKVKVQPHRRDGLRPQEVEILVTSTATSGTVIEGYSAADRSWLYRLATVTGLRRGELAALAPESFDWAPKALRVPASATKNGEEAVCRLPAAVLPGLRRWLRGRVGPLFPALKDKRVCKMLRLDMVAAGLPITTSQGRRTFHSLRNSFISHLWALGVPGPKVQRLARHSDIRLTAMYDRGVVDDEAIIDSLVK